MAVETIWNTETVDRFCMNTLKLDNPAWYSLVEIHKSLAIDYSGTKFYDPVYCPFGGYLDGETTQKSIGQYASLTADFYVIGNKPIFSNEVILDKQLVCDQMLLTEPIDAATSEQIRLLTTSKEDADLSSLVNLVQPGYFRQSTMRLGNYYGIYQNNQLVAAAGERMKMDGFTELSAIVTHPQYRGRGYARQLLTHITRNIFSEHKIPYLHVAESNSDAIRLYEKLGFRRRRKISFWHFLSANAERNPAD